MKHTPGPWTAAFERKWPYTVCVTASGGERTVMEQYGAAISSQQKTYDDYLDGVGFTWGDAKFCSRESAQAQVQEQMANAHLIAAAPDLLKIAERARNICSCTRTEVTDCAGVDECLGIAALQAIAKAEGRDA